ncbi:MAG: hypothetical protein JOS17DRAFT_753494 [Linnemannia elongata]|nr:MAG: hypothetical protein JOS17DRAFT_753494 [Linnemannia elongata]
MRPFVLLFERGREDTLFAFFSSPSPSSPLHHFLPLLLLLLLLFFFLLFFFSLALSLSSLSLFAHFISLFIISFVLFYYKALLSAPPDSHSLPALAVKKLTIITVTTLPQHIVTTRATATN